MRSSARTEKLDDLVCEVGVRTCLSRPPTENREDFYRAEQRTSAVGELFGAAMPAAGRYSSLGRCKGTIRIGSLMRGNFFFVLRVTFLFVMFSAARFHHHYHESAPDNTGSHCQCKGSLLPRW